MDSNALRQMPDKMKIIMKKIIGLLIVIAIFQKANAQTETFDIATYTVPQNWKKESREGGVVYSTANDSTGKFGAVIIFESAKGTGDVTKDFKLQWDELAVKKHNADPNPATEQSQVAGGWKALTGASLFKVQGIDAYIILTVFSGFGKRISIVSTLNDQAYLNQLDDFLKTVKLTNAMVSKPGKSTSPAPQVADKPNNIIVGTWSDYSGAMANYVTASGAFIASADTHEMHQYEFGNGNSFSYQYLGSMGSTMLYIKSKGTYRIDGDKLSFTTTSYTSCMGSNGMTGQLKEDKSKEITETYTFYIGPNKWEAGPFLNLHKDGNYYPWSDFPYDYYKKINAK